MGREYTVSYRRYEGTSALAPEWKRRNPRPDRFHPLIRLSGRWLTSLGFLLGGKIQVEASPGRLVLRAVPPSRSSELAGEVCEPPAEEL